MEWNFLFFFNSALLGVGLAMDAFSVSLANGLHEPCMKRGRMAVIAGVFAVFQALMPMTGWFAVHTFLAYFQAFEKFIPWIALILLSFIGGKMLLEGLKKCPDGEECCSGLGFGALLVQGVATSIDALSVGFTIAEYSALHAVVCSLMIAAVTFVICMGGLFIGKKFGTKFAGKASVFGGIILIAIGMEIFLTGILG
ncbi:MAG: manganese efflux pump [Clostridia bacterium]|nr:manganese efflux pump [Clostridia bacterium]